MKTSFRIITEEIRQPTYIATDGATFDSEAECLAHEQAMDKTAYLRVPNPLQILPYDECVDTDVCNYVWLNLRTENDIAIAADAYGLQIHNLKIGLNCVEVVSGRGGHVYDVSHSINNAITLLDFVGYDMSALKRKE